jgi:hypothetical protein
MARKQAGAHAKSPVELCFAARVRDTCMRTCVSTCPCTPGDVHMRGLQQHGARLGHRLGGGENVVALECKQRGAHTRTDRPGTAAAPPHASTHMHDDSHHDCCMSSRSCQVITIHTDVRPSVLYQACQTVRCASYRACAQAPTRLRWCCRRTIGAQPLRAELCSGQTTCHVGFPQSATLCARRRIACCAVRRRRGKGPCGEPMKGEDDGPSKVLLLARRAAEVQRGIHPAAAAAYLKRKP